MTKKKQESVEVENVDLSEGLKECFIITPIGNAGSDVFKKTEGLINSVLKPVLKEFGFHPLPAHHIDSSGSINKQIIDKIVNSELVIANLTGTNPNVMYELAIRHTFGKQVITLAEFGTKLPFDIVDQRTIFYDDSMSGVDILKPSLKKAIEAALKEMEDGKVISNPVYDAVKQVAAIHNLPTDQQDAISMVLARFDALEGKIVSKVESRMPTVDGDSNKQFRYEVEVGEAISSDKLFNIRNSLETTTLKVAEIGSSDSSTTFKLESSLDYPANIIKNKFFKLGFTTIRKLTRYRY